MNCVNQLSDWAERGRGTEGSLSLRFHLSSFCSILFVMVASCLLADSILLICSIAWTEEMIIVFVFPSLKGLLRFASSLVLTGDFLNGRGPKPEASFSPVLTTNGSANKC